MKTLRSIGPVICDAFCVFFVWIFLCGEGLGVCLVASISDYATVLNKTDDVFRGR